MFLGWCFCESTYYKDKPAGDTRDETTGHGEKHLRRTPESRHDGLPQPFFDKPKLDEEFYSPNYLELRRQLDATFRRITDAKKEKDLKVES